MIGNGPEAQREADERQRQLARIEELQRIINANLNAGNPENALEVLGEVLAMAHNLEQRYRVETPPAEGNPQQPGKAPEFPRRVP